MRTIVLILLTGILSACAMSGKTYEQTQASLNSIKSGEGRLYIYRPSSMGAAIRPSIFLDGEKIGDSIAYNFIVKDIPVGKHVLSAVTETEEKYTFSIKSGETIYIKTNIRMGLFLGRPEFDLVTPEQAKEDMKELYLQASEENK